MFGGVSRYFYELIRNTTTLEKPAELHVFQGIHINAYPLKSYRASMAKYFGIRHAVLPKTRRLFRQLNQRLFCAFARDSYGSRDVYHPTYYGSSVSEWRGSPVVVTVHDMILELFANEFPQREKLILEKKQSIQRADLLVAVSEATKRDLIELYNIPESTIRVVYEGGPDQVTSSANVRSFAHERPYVLYVGTRGGYKNFSNLLRAYASSEKLKKNFDLVCFGGGPFTEEELLEIDSAGCGKRVSNINGNDELLHLVYRNAALFIYPSLYEGFGLPILEAFACECPVVASDRGSIPEVGGNAVLYCDPERVDSICSTMETVVFDSGLSRQMVERGKLRKEKFVWSKMAREVVQVYREIAR